MTTKTLYAAQVRDMHTAVHNLIIFPERPAALKALKEVHQTQCWPQHAGPAQDVAEINFRAPPTEFKGHRLCIVNGKYKHRKAFRTATELERDFPMRATRIGKPLWHSFATPRPWGKKENDDTENQGQSHF